VPTFLTHLDDGSGSLFVSVGNFHIFWISKMIISYNAAQLKATLGYCSKEREGKGTDGIRENKKENGA